MGLTQKLGTIPLAIQTDSSNNVGIGGAAEAGWILKSTGNTKISSGSGTTVLQVNDTSTGGKAWSLISAGAGNAHSVPAGTFYLRNSSDGITALSVTSAGNVGIGTGSPTAKLEIQNSPANDWGLSVWANTTTSQSYGGIVRGGTNANDVSFRVNNAANSSTYFTVNGNGNVGIGTSSPSGLLQVGVANSGIYIDTTTQYTPKIIAAGTISDIQIQSVGNGGNVYLNAPGTTSLITMSTNGSERMRITSGGYFKASVDGTYFGGPYHEIKTNANGNVLVVSQSVTSGVLYGIDVYFSGQAPNSTGSSFITFYDTVNVKAQILSNGTFGSRTGTYGSIVSDINYKTEIVSANSQWDDIKKLRVVNFKFKEDVELEGDNALRQIGFIAQEVQEVSPNLVYDAEDRNGVKWKSVKTSIIEIKAIKALQEAMERIEQLEAKVTALENK